MLTCHIKMEEINNRPGSSTDSKGRLQACFKVYLPTFGLTNSSPPPHSVTHLAQREFPFQSILIRQMQELPALVQHGPWETNLHRRGACTHTPLQR